MKCENCGNLIRRTFSDNCVSKWNLYKKVAYYCDHCDKIFIFGKYKDIIDIHKYDGEYKWCREQNPFLKKAKNETEGQ